MNILQALDTECAVELVRAYDEAGSLAAVVRSDGEGDYQLICRDHPELPHMLRRAADALEREALGDAKMLN